MDSGTEKTSEIWNGVPEDGVYGVEKFNYPSIKLICLCSESIYALYSIKICYMGKEKNIIYIGFNFDTVFCTRYTVDFHMM